jgi:hypothetical protein
MRPCPMPRRVLLHLDDGRRVPLDPVEIFLCDADGDETVVRTRGRRRLREARLPSAGTRASAPGAPTTRRATCGVSFAAAYGGERVIAQLYLPKEKAPPYPHFTFLVRSGRAVLLPVFKGTYERRIPRGLGTPDATTFVAP